LFPKPTCSSPLQTG